MSRVSGWRRRHTDQEIIGMRSTLIRWTVCLGLASVLLLALPLFPLAVTVPSVSQAAEKAEPLDLNTATADQLKTLPDGAISCRRGSGKSVERSPQTTLWSVPACLLDVGRKNVTYN